MEHSGFWAMLSKKETEETAPVLKQVSEASARPNWGFRGATGVLSTTGDLFRWQQALFANASRGTVLEVPTKISTLTILNLRSRVPIDNPTHWHVRRKASTGY